MVNYLSQFNFKIVYKPEKTNLLPDLLSRNPILEYFEKEDAVKTVNLADFNEILYDHQKMGAELKTEKNIDSGRGLYYQKWKDKARILVSQKLGKKIIERIHEEYGHIGRQQMLATICPHYYFKNLDKIVHEYCRNCHICVENKTRRGRAIGLLSRLVPATHPFEIMSIDTVGGFSRYGNTAQYMHILEDHFRR